MRVEAIPMTIQSSTGTEQRAFDIGALCGARFAARDVQAKRRELDDLMVREGRYSMATLTNPSIFRIGRYLLTQDSEFEVQGALTGGEGEVVAIRDGDEVFISVGSDQCDRELDPLFPDKPKQMCPHPIATVAWPYAEVRDHWDQMQIHSEVTVGGHNVPLQDSPLNALVDLEYLLALDVVRAMPDPLFLYCGSAPFLDSVQETIARHDLPDVTAHGTGDTFLARLHDPILARTIEIRYRPIPLGDEMDERRGRPGAAEHHLNY
ncbi:MAG TPA: hypothetical protein DIT01_01920 [Lentisphaeria bacterium]|nr:hypothetical protein [Lentisphaeria bacterium]|tara:strand:+ start:5439 stop:6230 length:792 start_codon:yes stop_codon:yes gene_type:complete